MNTLLLPQADAQKLLDYLVERPYKEVHFLVGMLMNLQPPASPEQPQISQTKDAL